MRKCLHILPFILFLCLTTQSCSVQSLHEAQTVVAKADSLRTHGQPYTDSMLMAQAYTTLNNWQYFYPDDYAHACYHYGRILRNNDNPAEAMQAFINATHSRTKDYHILGRVYSNMGSICHLAGESSLSYDMYEHSANMFLLNGDSVLYYYGLNAMALELAVQGKKEETLSLLRHIEETCTDHQVLTKILETKAEIYNNTEPLDSAIYFINQLNSLGYNEPLGLLIKAQAFSRMGISDSAILYANIILSDSCTPYQHRFNALYILSHNDTTLDQNEIRTIASEREDIRYYEYEPLNDRMTDAVRLLEQDLHRKPDWRWIYVLVGLIALVGGCIGLSYAYHRSQIIKRNRTLLHSTLEKKCDSLSSLSEKQLKETIYWQDYNALCHFMNAHMNGIINKLFQQYTNLTEQNIRLCIVTLIGCPYKQCADMLRLSKASISKSKQILAEKLGTEIKNLRSFLLEMASSN